AMKRPILGSGYGTTVTYETSDPRLLSTIGSSYTTYAFEWGYHDIWLKIGVVGASVYAWFLYSLLRPLVQRLRSARADFRELMATDDVSAQQPKIVSIVTAGIFIGVLSVLATNIF